MSALSSQSRYFRFFSAISKLTDKQLHYFSEVDQRHHVAWIALADGTSEHHGVGIARFIRFKHQINAAEFAVTVIDRYQRRGLGTLLMAVLYLIAYSQGIAILRGFVLPENTVTIHWLAKLGAVGQFENGVYRMDLEVPRVLPCSPTPPLLQYYLDHAAEMKPIDVSGGD